MRILVVTGAYPPMKCGVGDYTARLVNELDRMPGVTAAVLTASDAAESSCRPSVFFPVVSRWGFRSLSVVTDCLRRFNPDIVHLQYPSSFGRVFLPNFLPLICKVLGIAVVQTWHEPPIYSQVINALPKDVLVVVESDYPETYSQPYRTLVSHKKCVHIPIGSNIPRFCCSLEQRNIIRERYNAQNKRMLVYFGFASERKGLDLLFRVADPDVDRLVLICDLNTLDAYHAHILQLANSDLWKGKCYVTGYMPDHEVASVLDSADAAVFPFVEGTSPRNGSVLAARIQGTFVVSTHKTLRGYNRQEHVFYTLPGDVDAIRQGLDCYAGAKFVGIPPVTEWKSIASRHYEIYEQLAAQSRGKFIAGVL